MKETIPTTLVYSDFFLNHIPMSFSPENPERLRRIVSYLKSQSELSLQWTTPQNRSVEQLLTSVHSSRYVHKVNRAARQAGQGNMHLDPTKETYVSRDTYKVSLLSVSAIINSIDKLIGRNMRSHTMCLNRPPGHHAYADKAGGFCIFNNIAIAAHYAQSLRKINSVLIIDFDIHQGDGTQSLLQKLPNVQYVGMHATKHYPYKPGSRKMRDIILPEKATDEDVRKLFFPKLRSSIANSNPDLILISAGFDGLAADKISHAQLSPQIYFEIGEVIANSSEAPTLTILEGGYDLENLGLAVFHYLKALQQG